MKYRLVICIAGFLLSAITLFGASSDSTNNRFILGFTGGFSQNSSLSGDVYGGVIKPLNNGNVEANFGYTYFNNKTSYRGVDDIYFNSHGIFVEGNYYFTQGLYGGVKFALNFNWVDEESQEKFNNVSFLDSPEFFIGQILNFQSGYLLKLNDNFFLRLQGQIGLHSFEIAEGEYWQLGGTDSPIMRERFKVQDKLQLMYNLSLGLTFRIDADIY